MKNAKVKVPLIITGVNIFSYIIPVADLLLMFAAPIAQIGLIIAAIVNRKWWLLSIHIPLTILMIGLSFIFFKFFFNIRV